MMQSSGYRFMEMRFCGRILYADDLNTNQNARANGELHLDSGVQRESAHRFYFRVALPPAR